MECVVKVHLEHRFLIQKIYKTIFYIFNQNKMDTLYYSNHCQHCKKLLQFIVKGNLTDKISCICIDTRFRDPKTGQSILILENQKQVVLPPCVHSVPTLLVGKNFNVMSGEQFFNASPQELEAKGSGGNRQMHNYVSANHDIKPINTVDDTYKPNKISKEVTNEMLQKNYDNELSRLGGDETKQIVTEMIQKRDNDVRIAQKNWTNAPNTTEQPKTESLNPYRNVGAL